MKRFIAFNGNHNSGIKTKEEAYRWAADHLAKLNGTNEVYIAEVTEVARRTIPTIETEPFFANDPVAKAA